MHACCMLSHLSHVPIDPPGRSVHGILQARILQWVAIPSSRGYSQLRDQTHVSYMSYIGRQALYQQHHLGSPFSPPTILKLSQRNQAPVALTPWPFRISFEGSLGQSPGMQASSCIYMEHSRCGAEFDMIPFHSEAPRVTKSQEGHGGDRTLHHAVSKCTVLVMWDDQTDWSNCRFLGQRGPEHRYQTVFKGEVLSWFGSMCCQENLFSFFPPPKTQTCT